MSEEAKTGGPRVLVVDDEEALRRAHTRTLGRSGFVVETAADGEAAAAILAERSFDVVVSDIDMPGMNGIRLLERIREHDLDVPVILMTGVPSLDTATRAVQHGALRYLVKPFENSELVSVVSDAVRLHRLARAKRLALDLAGGADRLVGDHAGLVSSFGRALDTLHLAYQPIVECAARRVFAFEALLRTREPALPHPGAVLDAAERLGRVHDVGRAVRACAAEHARELPGDALLFVNLHPSDLLDPSLVDGREPLDDFAERVVLEVTERASMHDAPDVRARIGALKRKGYRIAIDDLGAGYAGLSSFALLEPDVVKLDMTLVRGIHLSTTKQTLVRTMAAMCRELGIIVTTEGIEIAEEREALLSIGCDRMQGFLFARPGDPFPSPSFE